MFKPKLLDTSLWALIGLHHVHLTNIMPSKNRTAYINWPQWPTTLIGGPAFHIWAQLHGCDLKTQLLLLINIYFCEVHFKKRNNTFYNKARAVCLVLTYKHRSKWWIAWTLDYLDVWICLFCFICFNKMPPLSLKQFSWPSERIIVLFYFRKQCSVGSSKYKVRKTKELFLINHN